jgi:transposase-like protein
MLVVAGLVCGISRGAVPEAANGWLVEKQGVEKRVKKRSRRRDRGLSGKIKLGYWATRSKSWHIPLVRSLFLWLLWEMSGRIGSDWVHLLPWIIWLLPEKSSKWGWLSEYLWQIQRVLVLGYAGLSLYHLMGGRSSVMAGCVMGIDEKQLVSVERIEDGDWQATLSGRFTLRVSGDHPFRLRLLLIFLGLLQSENDQRKSRRTRDGRTPFVRQEQMAAWTNTKQEHISLWMKYWQREDWANLLSLKTAEVLTAELVERIVTVLATFPNWTIEQVHQHLHQEGNRVSMEQIEQASQVSGWKRLKDTLRERFDLQAGFRLRDEWLVGQLLHLVQELLAKLEAGNGLTAEVHITRHDLQTLAEQVGVAAKPALPVQPWLQALEGNLLGQWEQTVDPLIRCTYCGSNEVARKSKKPRLKKFYDAQGQMQELEVYRYYCHNPECKKDSFTHFPSGLLPYSPYRTQVHLLTLQMYAWGYSTYRRTSTALGVYSMTAWRWVHAWGHDLLPLAALFGVLRSSGAVGVDEKYVLVPKNNKPEGKMRRWMYVYLAVDVWTYDLLHIAIFPHNNDDSAKAFLLALRTKGYSPQVIVTDLRQDYGTCIAQVFPFAQHHECIFHALQNVQKHIKDVYGPQYAQEHPAAALLKQQIYAIFDTFSPDEAHSRFQEVLALKQTYLQATPASLVIFDFLQLHWPKLVNAIGSQLIPTTNNTTELVIRRFDQHYQNFCGFNSIESAQAYLAVFEKLYRFTPFSQDAQPRIRGKSPLQLAGYDLSKIPLSAICSGLSVDWPTEVSLVPK